MSKDNDFETDTAFVVDEEEKTTKVDVEETETKPVETKKEEPVKEKPVSDKSKVIIKCAGYEGKEIVLPTRTIKLNEKGCCEVTGEEAKRLLTIPGYELSK